MDLGNNHGWMKLLYERLIGNFIMEAVMLSLPGPADPPHGRHVCPLT